VKCTLGRLPLVAALSAVLLPVSAAHAADPPVAAPADTFGRVADAVFTERTAALLTGTQKSRTATPMSTTLARTENTALTSLHGTRSRLAALGEAYRAADTEVTVDRTRIRGRHATVSVTEATTLTYERIRGDEPPTTGVTAHHDLTFTLRPDGTWQLTAVRRTDKGPRPVNEPVPAAESAAAAPPRLRAIIGAPRAATTTPAPAKPKKLTGGTYDYAAMATYTEKYWRAYNPEYRKYNALGGDCTNYLSQGLLAGGWKQVSASTPEEYDTWFYRSNGTSDSWIGVNEWSWFTQTDKRTTALANVYQMDVGDVMQIDFNKDGSKDHSMMTTYRSSSGVPYLTYHDADTYRRSLASLIAAYPDAAYYAYRT
jgi:hypothetical protein